MLRIYLKIIRYKGVIDINSKEFYTVRGYHLLEQNKRLITPAMEDYLEMIYRCGLQEGYIKSTCSAFKRKGFVCFKMVQNGKSRSDEI